MDENDDKNMQELLNTAIEWKSHSQGLVGFNEIWTICHDLAEAQYQPALEFFLEGLNDPDWNWRETCLDMIGFHYSIPRESEITRRVRELLTSDPSQNVRMTAADVLGAISILPDQALVKALATDPDHFVRRSAYFALLKLAHIPYRAYLRERGRFESSEVEPSISEVKRIVKEEGICVPTNTFSL